MRLPVHHRYRILLVLLLSLLLQQAAMAAYACPLEQMPQQKAMPQTCAGMGMQQARDNPALCAKHCAPDLATATAHAALTVPASLLPPTGLPPVLQAQLHQGVARAAVPIARSDPPPRLRYCSLLI